jgi:hypothetical protein
MANTKKIYFALFMSALLFYARGNAQETTSGGNKIPSFAINSNLLYDATASINLGAEIGLSKDWTLKLPVTYNPWTFEDNKKMKFILVQPELRYWLCESFNGHFFGLHAHYAFYNVGGIGTTDFMKARRFQGNLYGGGLSYGYSWYLSPRWSLEASLGIGYAYLDYDVYYCEECGEWLMRRHTNYFGLTQVGLTLVYFLK